ncbi:MmcQ/YjbR family DNA-binding protein [Vermiculatibacterium agrestimuris]|uniref:MmcQ/YjbR family DNA-binding protein n=1 Tax=Vermiculatibacterium agrestimuris TaxID=2941519 RepID=UPI00203E61E1|nr:MmcQ/YjbR family DNA-binding protein [Vermiculatibacterium agrestimuris]
MNRYPWLEDYLLSKPGAVRDFKLEWQWHRWLVAGKMFAALCTPDPKYAEHAGRTMVILKCDLRRAELYRAEFPDVVPGFYSDKRTWNTVYLDGQVPEAVLREMCDESYALVTAKLTKALQRELGLL